MIVMHGSYKLGTKEYGSIFNREENVVFNYLCLYVTTWCHIILI